MIVNKLKFFTALVFVLFPMLALAQDFSLSPIYGRGELSGGFSPDPRVFTVAAGGNLSASNASSGCNGYITDAPTYSVNFNPGSLGLGIYINADFDTTIVINDPSGGWNCDDDYPVLGLDAGWYFDNPESGRYDIWVGAYSESDVGRQAVLAITEYSDSSWETDLSPTASSFAPEISLSGGFTPDPYTLDVNVIASGTIEASSLTSNSCSTGYFNPNASYRLNHSPGTLGLGIYLISDVDTTIAIRGPDGIWYCDDDHPENGDIGNDAGYYFSTPQAGNYDIYVGTFSDLSSDSYFTLAITEYSDGWLSDLSDTVSSDFYLNSGFTPDPYTLDVFAGGSTQATDLTGSNCTTGYFTSQPSYIMEYGAGASGLGMYIESDIDTALAILDPLGNWYCNDDHAELGVDAGYYFGTPATGYYDIYVGTYSERDDDPLVTLAITNASSFIDDPIIPDPDPPEGEIQFGSKL